jgi:hypothetical protein
MPVSGSRPAEVQLALARRFDGRITAGRALLNQALMAKEIPQGRNANGLLADIVVDLMLACESHGFNAEKILKLAQVQFRLRNVEANGKS